MKNKPANGGRVAREMYLYVWPARGGSEWPVERWSSERLPPEIRKNAIETGWREIIEPSPDRQREMEKQARSWIENSETYEQTAFKAGWKAADANPAAPSDVNNELVEAIEQALDIAKSEMGLRVPTIIDVLEKALGKAQLKGGG